MAYIKGVYTTNHPKDVAARRREEHKKYVRHEGCTRNELNLPTEKNVQKCMNEMRNVKRAEQFKRDGKFLDANTNDNKYRG